MLDITVRIEAPALAEAIHALAAAVAGNIELLLSKPEPTTTYAATVIQPQIPITPGLPSPALTTPDITAAIPGTVPTMTAAIPGIVPPVADPGAGTVVPTNAPTYTLEQLSVAATQLMDAPGHSMEELTAMLAQFGVQALTQLPQEQYGIFATHLRAKGARI